MHVLYYKQANPYQDINALYGIRSDCFSFNLLHLLSKKKFPARILPLTTSLNPSCLVAAYSSSVESSLFAR